MAYSKVLVNLQNDEKYSINKQYHNLSGWFIDGHSDFYQPEASPTGEVADTELAIVYTILTNIGGFKPLVRDEDIVVFGCRDEEQAASSSLIIVKV